eukprot:3685514-Alexandrium_andersonii.AAC.1
MRRPTPHGCWRPAVAPQRTSDPAVPFHTSCRWCSPAHCLQFLPTPRVRLDAAQPRCACLPACLGARFGPITVPHVVWPALGRGN